MILDVKKVSLTSNEPNKTITDKKLIENLNDDESRDKFYFVHIVFYLVGVMHILPFTFFVNANAYWMYKFRNVSAKITDTDARTILQTHFSPGTSIGNTVPVLVFMLGSTFYGHKIKARLRVLGSLFVFTVCFMLMTLFVEVNTDDWQLEFFVITMIILSFISGANAVFEIATLAILSKFPQDYMQVYLMGQGIAGIFNAVLQIISLAIVTSTITSALIYFVIGSLSMGLTYVLFFCSKYTKCYNYYVGKIEEDTKKGLLPYSEMKSLFKTLWPCELMYTFFMLTILPTHTAITALVVSEDYGNGNPWNGQTIFFVTTMLGIILINGTMSLFQASSMVLLSIFPPKYARPYLFGDSFSGIFNPLMQIISLAIGPSVQVAALIYFLAGTSVLGVTLLLLILSKYNSLFQYHIDNSKVGNKRPVFKLSEVKEVAIQIWPCLAIAAIYVLTLVPTHPSITALVVSENYGNGNLWSDKYFVPVITFFLTGVCILLGRIAAGTLTLNKSNSVAWVGLMTLRMFVFVPVIILCNALPRHNFPVVFTHDWEYILIIICFNLTGGFMLTIMFLGIPVLAPGKQEIAYLTFLTLSMVAAVFTSPLGLVTVKIL